MADSVWLSGDVDNRPAPVATATALEPGDLISRNATTGLVTPASSFTWDTDLATTQAAFVALFYGCSQQLKTANVARVHGNGDDNIVMIEMGGVREYDCASADFVFGQLLGPAKQSGNALENKKLVGVASESLATHICVRAGTSLTRIQAKMRAIPALV